MNLTVILPLAGSPTQPIVDHSFQVGDQHPIDHHLNLHLYLPHITHNSHQVGTTRNKMQPGIALITVPEEILKNVNSASYLERSLTIHTTLKTAIL